nr:magnesium chelatase domain-containing protein [Rhizobium leguminosarum]
MFDKAVAESRERVQAALHASGLALPAKRVTVNLAPADMLLPLVSRVICSLCSRWADTDSATRDLSAVHARRWAIRLLAARRQPIRPWAFQGCTRGLREGATLIMP